MSVTILDIKGKIKRGEKISCKELSKVVKCPLAGRKSAICKQSLTCEEKNRFP